MLERRDRSQLVHVLKGGDCASWKVAVGGCSLGFFEVCLVGLTVTLTFFFVFFV